jgi:hypothetical protein
MNAAEKYREDNKIMFAALDCTQHADACKQHEVSGYPTFKYFNYGKSDHKYTGGREVGSVWQENCFAFFDLVKSSNAQF